MWSLWWLSKISLLIDTPGWSAGFLFSKAAFRTPSENCEKASSSERRPKRELPGTSQLFFANIWPENALLVIFCCVFRQQLSKRLQRKRTKRSWTPGNGFPRQQMWCRCSVSKLWKGPTRKLGKYIIHGYPSAAFVFCSLTMTVILFNYTIISILTELILY